jgi:hypothetical protein
MASAVQRPRDELPVGAEAAVVAPDPGGAACAAPDVDGAGAGEPVPVLVPAEGDALACALSGRTSEPTGETLPSAAKPQFSSLVASL